MNTKCPQCAKELPEGAPKGLCPACLLKQGMASGTMPEAAGFTAPTSEELAPHFPQLEILELLGQGGMGVVYKARQKELDRFVALKILSPAAAEDPGFAERFTREARALASLNHPGIVAIHDFGQTDGIYWVMMEYIDGVNLRHLIRAKRMSPREAVAIVPQLCEALQYAHDEGVVHRDIKPENILLDRKGRVKIADFGLAKIVGRQPADFTLTGAGDKVGTPHYMAPEQVESSQEVDNRADIYSLGVVFYEMLTGELPLGRFAPPSRKVEIDVRLDEVVLRALEKEPCRRYQQASHVGTQVQTILSTPGNGEDRKKPPAKRAVPVESRLSIPAVVGALWAGTCLAAVLLLGLTWRLDAPEGPVGVVFPFVFRLSLMPLAVTAPIGTTICGGAALYRIRYSPGRFHGLTLALADLLFFPLLLLDVLTVLLCAVLMEAGGRLFGKGGASWLDIALIAVPLGVVLSVVVDVLIVRKAWRMACRPVVREDGGGRDKPAASTSRKHGWRVPALVIVSALALVAVLPVFNTIRADFGGMPSVERIQPQPRFDGIVTSHVDTYQSGTGVESDLIRGTQMNAGFKYGDSGNPDWSSTIKWRFNGHRDESDLYDFTWTFSPSNGAPVTQSKKIGYDGTKGIVVFENGLQVISIEPGSLPLPKDAASGKTTTNIQRPHHEGDLLMVEAPANPQPIEIQNIRAPDVDCLNHLDRIAAQEGLTIVLRRVLNNDQITSEQSELRISLKCRGTKGQWFRFVKSAQDVGVVVDTQRLTEQASGTIEGTIGITMPFMFPDTR